MIVQVYSHAHVSDGSNVGHFCVCRLRVGDIETTPILMCSESCGYSKDGECNDGGPGSDYIDCAFGTDCEVGLPSKKDLVLSCPVLSCPVLPCPVRSCLVLSCLSCPVFSCHTLSCSVLSCPVLSFQNNFGFVSERSPSHFPIFFFFFNTLSSGGRTVAHAQAA
jgi:hypothetical protein